jgi:hypothetical protein
MALELSGLRDELALRIMSYSLVISTLSRAVITFEDNIPGDATVEKIATGSYRTDRATALSISSSAKRRWPIIHCDVGHGQPTLENQTGREQNQGNI